MYTKSERAKLVYLKKAGIVNGRFQLLNKPKDKAVSEKKEKAIDGLSITDLLLKPVKIEKAKPVSVKSGLPFLGVEKKDEDNSAGRPAD